MKTTQQYYITPEIEWIRLDNEISLQLQSIEDNDPNGEPTGNGWSASNYQDFFNTNPLQEYKA